MHDKNGKPLKIGDKVTVTCEITKTHEATEYCNVTLETVEPMFPSNNKTTITLNTKQTELVE